MKKDKFVPMKISFNEKGYTLEVKRAEEKITLLEQAYNWCVDHIDVSKIDRHEFIKDMVVEFTNQVEQQKSDIVNTKLSIDKLMFLLDINIAELNMLKDKFDRIDIVVEVVNSDWKIEVKKESFITYTKTKEENEKLITGNNFIKAIDMLSKYRKVYPQQMILGTSNFIQYDMTNQKYVVNMSNA